MTKSASGKFSLIVPAFTWIQQEQTNRLHYGFDLVIENPDTGVWLRARVGPRSPRGMDVVLDEEVIFAKMLIDFRPENVEAEVSLDS